MCIKGRNAVNPIQGPLILHSVVLCIRCTSGSIKVGACTIPSHASCGTRLKCLKSQHLCKKVRIWPDCSSILMHDGRGHVDCTDSPNGEVVRRTPQPREGKGGGGGGGRFKCLFSITNHIP